MPKRSEDYPRSEAVPHPHAPPENVQNVGERLVERYERKAFLLQRIAEAESYIASVPVSDLSRVRIVNELGEWKDELSFVEEDIMDLKKQMPSPEKLH